MAALAKTKRNWPLTSTGSLKAIENAQSILDSDMRTPDAKEYRARVFELAEARPQRAVMKSWPR